MRLTPGRRLFAKPWTLCWKHSGRYPEGHMKQDRMLTVAAIIWLVIGFISMLSGHVVFGGIVALIGFGIFYLRGRGNFNDRSLYEKQIKANISIEDLYEKLKGMDTPIGKPWLGGHRDFKGDCIIIGPNVFWDCIVIAKKGSSIVLKHTMQMDKIVRSEKNEYRFDGLINPAEYDATPERYAIYASFKLASTVMLDHLCDLIKRIAAGENVTVPANLEEYKFYYHNSEEGWFKDSEGNDVLRVEASLHPFSSAVYDADDDEMAAVIPHAFNKRDEPADRAGFELTANGEHFGEIRRFRDRAGDGFIAETEDGSFRISLFPACRRGNISCNYRIEKDGKLMALIGGSPKLIFEGLGKRRNDIVLSYDDDYLVLYAILEVFILTINSRFLK